MLFRQDAKSGKHFRERFRTFSGKEAAMKSAVLARWRAWWDDLHDAHSQFIEQIPDQWTTPAIFLASALTLYVEMVMVRWHATCFHAFAIFKNVSLLSCFLGLGIGFGQAGRRRITLASFLP